MSEGAYLMEKIRSRCVEEGDCLIWPGALASGYCPSVRVKGKVYDLRRFLWKSLGKPMPANGLVIKTKCGDRRCLAEEHLKTGRRGPKKGTRRPMSHVSKMAALRQAQSSLSVSDVEAIRISDKTLKELSAQYGKAVRTIQNIRNGKSWNVTSGVFAGLGARI